MSFFDSIKEFFYDYGLVDCACDRVLMLGDCAVYIENVKAILACTDTQVRVSLKKGVITVQGEKLYLKKYCDGDLAICGKIALIQKD